MSPQRTYGTVGDSTLLACHVVSVQLNCQKRASRGTKNLVFRITTTRGIVPNSKKCGHESLLHPRPFWLGRPSDCGWYGPRGGRGPAAPRPWPGGGGAARRLFQAHGGRGCRTGHDGLAPAPPWPPEPGEQYQRSHTSNRRRRGGCQPLLQHHTSCFRETSRTEHRCQCQHAKGCCVFAAGTSSDAVDDDAHSSSS